MNVEKNIGVYLDGDFDKDKILIFYHKEDNDGIVSGALIYHYLTNVLQIEKENIVCIGLDYNDIAQYKRKQIKALKEVYQHIFITDLSFPIPLMEYFYKLWGNNFIWFDHHRPVIEASFSSNVCNCHGVREINRSAILCVWKYFYDPFDSDFLDNRSNIPELLRALSGWDSFTYADDGFSKEYVRQITYGITNIYKLNLFKFAKFLEYADKNDWFKLLKDVQTTGIILCNDEDFKMQSLIERNGDLNWQLNVSDGEDHSCCAIFMIGQTNSVMFDSVKNKVRHGVVFKRNSNGTWGVSLYNTDEHDDFHIGKFCREFYKGGGHSGAGGFQIKQSKMFKMLKTKKI